MADIERALLLDLVCGKSLSRLLLPQAFEGFHDGGGGPGTHILRGAQLEHLRRLRESGNAAVTAALAPLLDEARISARNPSLSVHRPGKAGAAAGLNDYVSLAKYWWPGPDGDGGKYVRRDGQVNPACFTDAYDYVRLTAMCRATLTLALAAFLAGDPDLGRAGAGNIRIWFLDPLTAQTPHFEFAQIVPGRSGARGAGTIEIRHLMQIVEAAEILGHCGFLDEGQLSELGNWFRKLLDWMLTSENGRAAASSHNNIALWFFASCHVFARFTRDAALAEDVLARAMAAATRQISADGGMPAENERARPHDYTAFSLLALSILESASRASATPIPSTEDESGRALTAARDWLLALEEAWSIRGSVGALAAPSPAQAAREGDFDAAVLSRLLAATQDSWARDSERLNEALARRDASPDAEIAALRKRVERAEEELIGRKREQKETSAQLRLEKARAMELKSNFGTVLKDFRRRERRLKRHRRMLAAPFILLTAPISVPYLLFRAAHRKKRRRQMLHPAESRAHSLKARLLRPFRNASERSGGFSDARAARKPGIAPEQFYPASEIDPRPDTYILYRIIGNDLIPRHGQGQSRTNVQFILDNEPELENCEKRWIVNRIVDPSELDRIVSLLESRNQRYKVIPFDPGEYRRIGWDLDGLPSTTFFDSGDFRKLEPVRAERAIDAAYRLKNLYVMNNNGARNAALEDGRGQAKWILPWDGNCFLSARAWRDVTRDVAAQSRRRYFAVPMQRISDNAVLLHDDFEPEPLEEPQLLFRTDAVESFNPEFPYGRRPKVELFWRLGISGPWDRWKDEPWDRPRRPPAADAGLAGSAGWVARLSSGVNELEEQGDASSFRNRGLVRAAAIRSTIDMLDRHLDGGFGLPVFYRDEALEMAGKSLVDGKGTSAGLLAADLLDCAGAAMRQGLFSVVDKTSSPPSGDPHDYWHPAPYWWPNPRTADGLPYVRRDGQRAPGTRLFEPESHKYDRTRLQQMFDNTTICALAARLTGRKAFAEHGANLVRTWFLDPATRMNPHLNYAQVRMGKDGNRGAAAGVIEFKDIYHLLDAVRLLEQAGALGEGDRNAFAAWLHQYRDWLADSDQGYREATSANNHGTYFDLQAIAIASYLEDAEEVRNIYFRSLSRVRKQITAHGEQPEEMSRTLTQHYVAFNLQGLLNIFRIARASGRPLLGAEKCGMDRLESALGWILSHDPDNWPFKQIEPFDRDRILPLVHSARALGIGGSARDGQGPRGDEFLRCKPVFDPHDAVHPFWNIGEVTQ